jgi:hypothetical protein
MRCSKEDYLTMNASVTRDQVPEKSWTFRNIQAWRIVNSNSIDGHHLFHPLSPGLYPRGTSNEKSCVVKPAVVIYKIQQPQSIPASPSTQRSPKRATEEVLQDEDQYSKRGSPSQSSSQSDRPSNSGGFLSGLRSKK